MTATPAPTGISPLLIEEINGCAEDIARLLGPGTDAGAAIPGALWSVGEAAAHLALANQLMAELAQGVERPYGDGTPGSLAEANARSLADYGERDPAVLAGVIVEQARAYGEAAVRNPGAGPMTSPLGPMDMAVLGSYLLTHMLGHGYDLARALKRPHMIDARRVGLAMPFLLTAMPRVLNADAAAGHRAGYAIGLRGGERFGERFGVTIADGAAVVGQVPERPDCVIVCEPVTFFLMALGRRGPWAALARGGVVARGRKPWLAPGFTRYFTAP